MLTQRRHTRAGAAAAAAAAHAAAPLGEFSALPRDVLLALLSTLPLDALLRCGALNTSWAALLASSPALFARLSLVPPPLLAPRVTPVDDDSLARLCARAGGALRALVADREAELTQLTAGGVLVALTQAPAGGDNPGARIEELVLDAFISGNAYANDPRRTFSLTQLDALRAACPALARGSVAVRCKTVTEGSRALSLLAGVNKSLDISGLHLDAPALQALTTAAIAPRAALRALDLRACGLDAAGVGTLSANLNALPVLRVLLLSNNSVGDAGVASLAAALTDNTALQVLELRKTGVTATGANALAAALRRNASLLKCDLSSNKLASAGVAALAATLGANSTLRELHMNRRDVDADALRILADAVAARHAPLHVEWHFLLRVERIQGAPVVQARELRPCCRRAMCCTVMPPAFPCTFSDR
jgi:hypothetical protein